MRVGPAADNASMLDYPFWVSAPASYAPFPPGWPALLALGELLGAPWLVNPILGAAVPVLVWAIARHWADEAVARLAVVVAALSPAVWIMAASRMSHTSALVALGAVALVAMRRPAGIRYWALGGLAAAYVVLARPLDALLVAVRCWPGGCAEQMAGGLDSSGSVCRRPVLRSCSGTTLS